MFAMSKHKSAPSSDSSSSVFTRASRSRRRRSTSTRCSQSTVFRPNVLPILQTFAAGGERVKRGTAAAVRLAPLPLRRPLLRERRGALAGVLGGEDRPRDLVVELPGVRLVDRLREGHEA